MKPIVYLVSVGESLRFAEGYLATDRITTDYSTFVREIQYEKSLTILCRDPFPSLIEGFTALDRNRQPRALTIRDFPDLLRKASHIDTFRAARRCIVVEGTLTNVVRQNPIAGFLLRDLTSEDQYTKRFERKYRQQLDPGLLKALAPARAALGADSSWVGLKIRLLLEQSLGLQRTPENVGSWRVIFQGLAIREEHVSVQQHVECIFAEFLSVSRLHGNPLRVVRRFLLRSLEFMAGRTGKVYGPERKQFIAHRQSVSPAVIANAFFLLQEPQDIDSDDHLFASDVRFLRMLQFLTPHLQVSGNVSPPKFHESGL